MFNRQFKRAITPIAAVLILCLTAGAPIAQVAQVEKVDLEMMKKIRDEGMERSKVMETLSWMTDVIGPRLTGSPQMKHANEWTKNKLAEWGLRNARLESWGPFGRGWSLQKFSANVTEPVAFPIIGYPKAWTPGTNGPIAGEVVYLDIKTDADFEKYRGKLKGAIVLTMPMRQVNAWFKAPGVRYDDQGLLAMANAAPPGASGPRQGGQAAQAGGPSEERMREFRATAEMSAKRNEFIRSEGAAVLVDASRNGDGGTLFVSSGGPRDRNAPQALPSITMTVEHYGRIVRTMEKGQKVKMEVDIQVQFHDDDPMGYNTTAEIPGSDLKDEVVMAGGHLDSWHGGTGATDNAAGCAVGMEALRILKAMGVQPRRTIRIGLWSGEEQGLLGSRAYVAQHFGARQAQGPQPAGELARITGPQGPLVLKPEHEKFSVYFNLDNGTGKIRGVYMQGNEAVRPIFRSWLQPFGDLGASTLTISNTGGTDHLAFDGVGLPGFQFIQDPVEYDSRTHHSNMDVYERIQADDMKQASVIMAAFLYNAAMRDEKFPRKPLPPGTQPLTPPVAAAPAVAPLDAKAPANSKPAKAKTAEKGKKQD